MTCFIFFTALVGKYILIHQKVDGLINRDLFVLARAGASDTIRLVAVQNLQNIPILLPSRSVLRLLSLILFCIGVNELLEQLDFIDVVVDLDLLEELLQEL